MPIEPTPLRRRVYDRLVADRGPGKKKLWALIAIPLGILAGICALALMVVYFVLAHGLPSIEWARHYRPPIVTTVWSGDEQLVGEFYDERRVVVPYEKIPKRLKQAVIASEDKDFFEHGGVSFTGLVRALFQTYILHHRVVGGSTLSQQTAKAIMASVEGEKSVRIRSGWAGVRRKAREFILTRRLETNFDKEHILWLYLNEVYFGHHSYGVQAAAQNYFRKNVWELTLPEISLIAGLPQAPSSFSPFAHPERSKARRAYVLRRMFEEGMITAAERKAAEDAAIEAYAVQDIFRETSPYVTEHIRRDLVARYGNERLLKEGLKVYATVDLEREHDAVAATIKGVIEADKRQGYRGPLLHLAQKEWEDFAKKEQAFLEGDGKHDEVIAALVISVDRDGKAANIRVGDKKGVIPLDEATWARKPNPEVNSEYTKITTLRGVLTPGDVVLVRASEAAPPAAKKGKDGSEEPPPSMWALEQDPKLQGALISTDPNSGYVVAMIGGYDFEKSEFNRAFQACRQPGSAFKPVIYSAAIEQRGFTASTILLDAPIVTDDDSTGRRWKPQNYEEEFKGEVPVRQALIHSMNTPAIRTLQAVGVKAAAAWAHTLGISTKINEDLSMALGSSCVYPSELTGVYATIARMGRKAKMIYLRRVLDRDGRILEDHSSFYDPWTELADRVAAGYAKLYQVPDQVMKPETAFLMQQLMTEVCKPPGTGGRAAALGKPVAGKTGTTNDLFDAWFLGYTRDLVTGVWVGYDTYETPMDKYATGGHYALPIWLDYMSKALKGVPQGDFEAPSENIVWVNVDGDTGKRATADTRQPVLEAYLKGSEPPDESGTIATAPGQPPRQQQTPDAAQTADQIVKGGL
ncbi:MAG TPA: PBP1A family penicillin-binding protein [Myxococcales bacterium]|nr:PBP1A family penicillin-binding protein [Myxococcales bacterium]